mmetsp:Transcript_35728/g.80743  ORF Transcript_35728/g.80743 Transcript_35728/m.80743 type:complete len:91 (+) Transcript_35728:346-618(+)
MPGESVSGGAPRLRDSTPCTRARVSGVAWCVRLVSFAVLRKSARRLRAHAGTSTLVPLLDEKSDCCNGEAAEEGARRAPWLGTCWAPAQL